MAGVATLSDRRGQLLLVGAIGMGVLLVVLAVLLNTAVYSQTLAAQQDGYEDEREAMQFQNAAERALAEVLVRVNERNSSTHDELHANLESAVQEWDAAANRHAALDGAAGTVSLEGTANGTKVVQDDDFRNFTDATGSAAWTPAENVSNLREFRMNVSREALHDVENETCAASGECFNVTIRNETNAWRLYVYTDDGEIRIENESGDAGPCSVVAESARIDVNAGTVGGEECEHLSFAGVAAPYAVEFGNADRVRGEYELRVDRRLSNDARFEDDGSPRIEPIVYAATASITYRTPDLAYETELRVERGETDG